MSELPTSDAMNTSSEATEVAGVQEAERSTGSYTADNDHSNSVAAVGHSSAPGCAHEGFYYCKKCGEDLTPDIRESHGLYNDSPGAARSVS